MNLLLFLSAILSALTGVVTGVRTPEVPVQRCAQACTMRTATSSVAPPVAGHRHLLGGFGLADLVRAVPVALIAAPRLWLGRPRA